MPVNEDDPNQDSLIGFWGFDTGLGQGSAFGDTRVTDGRLVLDGNRDYYTAGGTPSDFDIDEGAIRICFSPGEDRRGADGTLVNRGEFNDRSHDGYFSLSATANGGIEVIHESGDAELFLQTRGGLFSDNDDVEVTYSWSSTNGGSLLVRNHTTDTLERVDFATTGLTFETVDDDGETFTLGAREVSVNSHSKYFNGSIESFSVYDENILNASDGIVSGTDQDDLIDINYTGDPDGDRIDNQDAILPGHEPDDDVVRAGDGDDTVRAGLADDYVLGGDGDDLLEGEAGDDTLLGQIGDDTLDGGDGDDRLLGGRGDDTLDGGDGDDRLLGGRGDDSLLGGSDEDTLVGGRGDDFLFGGSGNDILYGGHPASTPLNPPPGDDSIFGGDDRDYISGVSAGDFVDGGSGGDDNDTLDLRGSANGGTAEITYTSPNNEDGFVTYFDENGNQTGTLEFLDIENIIPICFTPGSLIATPYGERPIEDLRAGDKVITRDNGIQEICWSGSRGISRSELNQNSQFKPIKISKGALGGGLPERDMWLSPNHRVLVSNEKTMLYFEESEVLVAAKYLTALPGIEIADPNWTTYIHLMFEQHEVILSDGAWSESFQPGGYSLEGVGKSQRLEIEELFPELKTDDGLNAYIAARRSLKRYEANLLVRR